VLPVELEAMLKTKLLAEKQLFARFLLDLVYGLV
jgi:hypothetical protein